MSAAAGAAARAVEFMALMLSFALKVVGTGIEAIPIRSKTGKRYCSNKIVD